MDPVAIQNAVQAAVAAVLQDQAVINAIRPPVVVPQPAPPVPFAVNPAGAGNAPWDFTSPTGLKIFIASTTPLSVTYDGKEDTLRDFLRKIYQRAESYGWTGILMVLDTSGTLRNITTHHGCITLANVQAHATTYLRLEQREHQASVCLRKLIIGSITPKLADRLATRSDRYIINAAAAAQPGQPAPAPIMIEDGTCMLHEIIKLILVETRASVAIITKKLTNLEAIMEEAKSDVQEFNSRVEELISQLDARSVEIPPMLENFFEGYTNCADLKFVEYMARKQEAYEDATIDLEYPALMKMALERFKILVDKKVWLKKTEQELEILTLKAEISHLKTSPSSTKSGSSSGKKAVKKGKDDDKYAWKQVAPKEGEPHDVTRDGKEYIYCPHHHTTKWVLKVNNKGVEHRTGCSKLKEMGDRAQQGQSAAALANAMEETDADTSQEPEDESI
ncbi:unknown protein [Seminavis robusta]|uniref:Uncharacterized protein n=1 Tax=Seminavis robusta TaxID=568900 RepID=A0A9N8HB57_9STRA|nr:unknown protein [Seminavis robusta]|eukprot:Sro349_g123350.1 n/a (449) ;mRNA; r:2884-4230